jgi:hypothetical protein
MTTGIAVKATIKETREANKTKPINGILGYAKRKPISLSKTLGIA